MHLRWRLLMRERGSTLESHPKNHHETLLRGPMLEAVLPNIGVNDNGRYGALMSLSVEGQLRYRDVCVKDA